MGKFCNWWKATLNLQSQQTNCCDWSGSSVLFLLQEMPKNKQTKNKPRVFWFLKCQIYFTSLHHLLLLIVLWVQQGNSFCIICSLSVATVTYDSYYSSVIMQNPPAFLLHFFKDPWKELNDFKPPCSTGAVGVFIKTCKAVMTLWCPGCAIKGCWRSGKAGFHLKQLSDLGK